ncbi:hypothetical protein [Colwellia psychrerythraea]|uniref:Lipoprotein n=1 Tax=Colwellia psychrerythraea TaxID=28229 RepID=A0A099KAW7_COLPS|nr:hypothetical protein [Colwellia psychrerythraea]KGJ87445.1 hypothetical protein GAB14E_4600 [Colwellia psychrerythraea]
MKKLLLPIILLLASCASTSETPKEIELTGRLLGSFVSTSAGLLSGDILHIDNSESKNKVSKIANGNPKKVFVTSKDSKALDGFVGKSVRIVGDIISDHKDAFHTDFTIQVKNITKI